MRFNRDFSNESLYSQEDFYDHEFIKKKIQNDKAKQNDTPENSNSIENSKMGYQRFQSINDNANIDFKNAQIIQQNHQVQPDQNDYSVSLQKQQKELLYPQNQNSEHNLYTYEKYIII
ncbi:hypothetical protein TTHERM_00470680 (macronuclear) [Tetrahymena thermophila SB210]|uniref:Uncharacterized protein n=1 Tax=Tetrahymena thermophila (strain SB210) TaxID=312017 RepID=I7MGL6_TETTS|nr:hypothetical protein TTHERM_00470680 [Tetrahymena thermophila SB210]EAR85295.2 hypothetical protein TTHERM_00470680 [Tetrahymena thermophila SB210]|eukprot:XP_001032958.2 hypothetical protein TTHERM_00470680 [Tetrahymena thermophila SB210]